MLRRPLVVALAMLAVACGKAPEPSGDAADQGAPAGPDVAVTAAPGVAFNYRYDFTMPSERIAATQERHAAACEALGVARCRITGLSYRLADADTAQGMLAFKLAPALARAFGKQGIAAVEAAGGALVQSEISGEDAGQRIADSEADGRDLAEERRTIEAGLARRGLSAAERAQLQAQLAAVREKARTGAAARTADRQLLAATPVVFNYETGTVRGRFGRSRLGSALADGWDNIGAGVAVILYLAITLLPWVIAAALLAWAWSRLGGIARRRGWIGTPPPA